MPKSKKSIDEAEATVRKKNGKYFDLVDSSSSKSNLTNKDFNEIIKHLRLRFSLTPACNLFCVFCSNEGLNYGAKSQKHADIDSIIKLSEILIEKTNLRSVDFSGGEPTTHPDFTSGEFRLIRWTKKYPDIRFSIHSNGVNLNSDIINAIKDNFSRVGISVHSLNFKTWNSLTNNKGMFKQEIQKKKFAQLKKNLDYIAQQNISDKVFIKSVVVRGFNDSEEELGKILDYCAKHNFHPKFLEFEPQFEEHRKYIVGRKELFAKLERLGCKFAEDAPRHNDPKTYIPGVNFDYQKNGGVAGRGLHSIFGCGKEGACKTCYDFLCMFVKPSSDGKGLYLKPCSVLDTKIDLTHALKRNDKDQIVRLLKLSREYLMCAPGLGVNEWNKERDFMSSYEKNSK